MFGIGSTELIVILIVALIVLGPKNLANVSRVLGKAMGEFRRISTDFQRTLNAEAAQAEEEAKLKANNQSSNTTNDTNTASNINTSNNTNNDNITSSQNQTEYSPLSQAINKAKEEAENGKIVNNSEDKIS